MLFMAVYHGGPLGLFSNVPVRWQHGPTAGVTVHGAWVNTSLGAEKPADTRTYVVFECEADQVAAYINWMRPFCPAIEVHQVNDYLSGIRAYEARDPEQWPRPPQATEEQFRAGKENFTRYRDASTRTEALRLWMETEPVPGMAGAGGAELVRARKLLGS